MRYVDRDPGPGFSDFRCGVLGSDGHDGTDFALSDPQRMAAGVPVLASAAGVVRGVRDGVPDQPADGRLTHNFGAMNCGNGVLLTHDGGWETQYCHLRRGSVRAVVGEQVTAGQPLGLVGMSGEANFPHVHLSVRHDGATVDPYTGAAIPAACGVPGPALWKVTPGYAEMPIAVVGLTDHVPERDAIVAGTAAARLERASGALVGYFLAYGLRAGDHVELKVFAPDGGLVSDA
ncbi:MAG: M23 family metallopeptidase, partial [Geminicoccaceae bacterium]